jgi:penicillin-binding protein 1A
VRHLSINLMRKKNLRPYKRIAVYVVIATGLLSILSAFILFLNIRSTLPGMAELRDIRHHQASQVLSADGEILGGYFFQNRTQVDLEEISPLFIDALIAVEDIRFYEHNGIDRRALARVFVKSILLRQDAGGGSTLTQQLAKNLYPRNGPGVINLVSDKIREMIIARRLETLYDKDEILELYLNTVSFGEETFGIETASHRFFSKPSIDLELHEAATLAGVLRAPGLYNPHRNPERSELRRNVVLRQMERYDMITSEEADIHIDKPLETDYNKITENEGPAPYFREHLRVQLQELLNSEPAMDGNFYNIYTDGLIIQTTIHSAVQSAAEQALTHRMRLLQEAFNEQQKDSVLLKKNDPAIISAWRRSNHYQKLVDQKLPEDQIEEIFHTPKPMNVFTWDGEEEWELSPHDSLRHYLSFLNAGLLAISPDNGEVKAWVGGIKHKYFQYDHVKSKRQTGSAFKPVVYAAALESGRQPCDYQRNLLSTYEAYEEWTPRNIREEYGGRYSLQAALARSVNTIAVDVLMETGIGRVQQVAMDMGIQSRIPGEPSIALGTAEISLLEMITAYASFANGGYRTYPYYLKAIYDPDGRLLYRFDNPNTMNPERERALSEETASAMVSMLSKAVDEGTGYSLRSQYGITHALAGKTGTTQEFTDGWFIGMTPNLVFGSWVGGWSPRIRFSEELGYASHTALPIAGEFLVNLQKDTTMTSQPDSFHTHQINIRFNTQCEDYRDDSTLDKLRDFFTGRDSDEARTVKSENEKKNIIDRVRDLFRRN